ncbi:UNVERIFIED_ORG: CBS domain-containing protein [Rhizobium esperanzae]
MTTTVVSISPDVSVRHAVAMMLQNHVSGLPVVDGHGRVCGMVTEGDLLLRREVRSAPRPARAPELISQIDLERYIGSRRDILRVIAEAPTTILPRGDEAIRLAVRTRLRSDLGLTPQRVHVSVRNGQVTVDGQVESELKRRAIRVLVEGLGGIAGYKDCLLVSPAHIQD